MTFEEARIMAQKKMEHCRDHLHSCAGCPEGNWVSCEDCLECWTEKYMKGVLK